MSRNYQNSEAFKELDSRGGSSAPAIKTLVQCGECEEWVDRGIAISRFASDLAGHSVCTECADQIIEDNDQFGVGA